MKIIAAAFMILALVASSTEASAQRRGWGGGGWHGGGWGGGGDVGGLIIGGIIGGVAGSILAPRPYYPSGYYDPQQAYCQSRFRSYDPYSRTYLGYDGYRHYC